MTNLSEQSRGTPLESPVSSLPPVTVFFSFLDKRSFAWITTHKIVESIRHGLPAGTKVARYHNSYDPFGWGSGERLTHAWAVAVKLHCDDKIIEPLFVAIQQRKEISDLEGIREVFAKVGVSKTDFDRAWNEDTVLKEKDWMNEVCRKVGPEKMPAIVLKGTYVVNVDDMEDKEDFGRRTQEMVKGLLQSDKA
ncbi:hypothetical protein LTR41_011224 [Exophiala xenobiotica]|nr:hypothetical protein LTR41_011224 [Exophiala xenobiotica]KAK5550946.1 hypothetical protein LTR46_011055 [Exophiala xenobiotica]